MRRTTLALSLLAATSAFATPGSGDLWEVTTQMSMEGMPAGMMPARTNQVCSAHDWNKPPIAQDEQHKCDITDWSSTPTKSSWKMHCPADKMDGTGEITRTSPDAYTGVIKMTSPHGVMNMNLSGKKIGVCDAEAATAQRQAQMAAVQSQTAAALKQADDAKDQACKVTVQQMDLKMLEMQAAICDPAKYKPLLCEHANSDEGYKQLKARPKDDPNSLTAIASACGMDIAAKEKDICAKAAAGESDLDYVARNCPEEAAPIAKRECAGRDYTALAGTKYAGFCATYAAAHPMPGASPPPADAKSKAKKTLKSLFGH
jgi:uncharacterized protein DUF3617